VSAATAAGTGRSGVLGDRRLAAVLLAGAALRFLAVAGVTPTVYVDSIEYRDPAFLGGHRRPWTVPLLYELVGDRALRVAAHAALGAAAWAFLAIAVAESVRRPALRVAAAAAVVATGLTTAVVNYDTTITSETVAVSLTAALLAAWVRFANAPTAGRAATVVAIAVPFAFTRNDHPLLVSAMAVLAVAAWLVSGRRRAWALLAAGLVVTAVWSVGAWRRNTEIERFNLALVVANRIVPVPSYLDWFEDRGMPRPDDLGLRADGDVVLSYAEDEDWDDWAGDEGRATYARFLLTHPGHLLLEPFPDLFGLRSTSLEVQQVAPALLSPGDRYGRVHPVLPDPVEAVLFGPGNAGSVVLAAGVLGSQADFDADPARAAEAVAANYGGAVSTLLHVSHRLRAQGHGAIVVLSSVAGERVRAANFVYGSTKAGLDAFAQGLGDSLAGTGVRVLVVRPGFVRTQMTEGMDAAPFATTPEVVAEAVADGLAKGREVVWAPGILRFVFAGFRHLPRPLWRRIAGSR